MPKRKGNKPYKAKFWRIPTWWIENGKRYEEDDFKTAETAKDAEAQSQAEMDVLTRLGFASEVGVGTAVEQVIVYKK